MTFFNLINRFVNVTRNILLFLLPELGSKSKQTIVDYLLLFFGLSLFTYFLFKGILYSSAKELFFS